MPISVRGKKVVVWEGGGAHDVRNNIFKREVVKERWYRAAGPYIYERCLARGFQLVTPDIYFSLSPRPKAIAVRDSAMTHFDSRLRDAGVKHALLLGSEHPLYACLLYWNLEKYTRDFDYAFIMKGAESWVAPGTKFLPWFTPHAYSLRRRLIPDFRRKRYLTLINSNQRIRFLKRAYVKVMNAVRPLPTLVNREGYVDRLEAIRYFSRYEDFDLYGNSWDRPVPRNDARYRAAIDASYRGQVYDKFSTLERYKFSIVIENSFFAGMMTEKIIDSLFAGCVPVYWGAPNVTDYLPEDVFIDFRKFHGDYIALDDYLRNMDEATYRRYIENINAFIASPYAYNLSQKKYVDDLLAIFESYF